MLQTISISLFLQLTGFKEGEEEDESRAGFHEIHFNANKKIFLELKKLKTLH